MNEGVKTIIYPVKDVAKAKEIYTQLLGVKPAQDEAYYVGYKVDGMDIGLNPNGFDQGITEPIAFYTVSDIKMTMQSLLEAGAQEQQAVRNVGGGRLTATVKDPDGNIIGLIEDTKKA